MDTRWLAYVIWGLGTVLIYGLVLDNARHRYRKRPDARSRRELFEKAAGFIVALNAFVAITVALWGTATADFRGLVIAVALGAFTAKGAIELRDEPDE